MPTSDNFHWRSIDLHDQRWNRQQTLPMAELLVPESRAGHLGFAVRWLKSKDCFQAKMTIQIISLWVRPIKITYPQSKSLYTNYENAIFPKIKWTEKPKVPSSAWPDLFETKWTNKVRPKNQVIIGNWGRFLSQSWALSVFLNFFNNKKWFLAFFIKLSWLGVGFLNMTGAEIGY